MFWTLLFHLVSVYLTNIAIDIFSVEKLFIIQVYGLNYTIISYYNISIN